MVRLDARAVDATSHRRPRGSTESSRETEEVAHGLGGKETRWRSRRLES